MIVQEPSKDMFEQWKNLWERNKNLLRPNRKTGEELLTYLQSRYHLTEIFDEQALAAISENVTMNQFLREKLPAEGAPNPRAFYLENTGEGERFYIPENRDPADLWGAEITRIFVGIDLSSGFYMAEGSTLLWDELCAFQGIDEMDLENYVIVAQYLLALQRFERLEGILES
jgi:hypothetical protein